MDWNQAVDIMGNIAGSEWSRSDVVEGVYLAMRVISHRDVLASNGIGPEAYLRRGPESSLESRRLALTIVEEILSRESVPLDKIRHETADLYISALWEVTRRRLKQDLQYDEERGAVLLEEMRRADPLHTLRHQ